MELALQNAEKLLKLAPEQLFRLRVGVEYMPSTGVRDQDRITRTGEQGPSQVIGIAQFLFIGGLSFDDQTHMNAVRLGVLAGSAISAIIGYAVLRWVARPAPQAGHATEKSHTAVSAE